MELALFFAMSKSCGYPEILSQCPSSMSSEILRMRTRPNISMSVANKNLCGSLITWGLGTSYVRERLITVGQNHLARMHANPLVEHTVNSAGTNIAWDKYKTPISILKPPDWSTDTDYKMQENEVTSLNVQPLIQNVVSGPYTDTIGTVLGLRIKANTATW